MSKNKHALIRYRALDECFRNHRIQYTFNDLLTHVNARLEAYDSSTNGISRAQLYDDIAFMESSDGWMIDLERIRVGRKVYMRYSDPGFSINNMPLNELEIDNMKEAIGILAQFKGMPQFEWIQEIMPKLENGISREEGRPVIGFETNQYLKGIEWLGRLHSAIRYRRVLNVTYQDFHSPSPYQVEIHPYYLKQYNGRWFLLGYNPVSFLKMWVMALDRIVDLHELPKQYLEHSLAVLDEYFDDIIGVSRPIDGKVEKIVLQIAKERAGYVLTKPFHGSQKKIQHDGECLLISLEVIVNRELIQLLLSFGDQLKVISPVTLRELIIEKLRTSLLSYEKPSTSHSTT